MGTRLNQCFLNSIVNELAADPRIAMLYDLWYEQRENVLRTLEILDDDGKFVRKADIFTKRTILPGRKSPMWTLLRMLGCVHRGAARVDIPFMAGLTGKTEEEFKALGAITGGDIHIGCAESEGIKHLARCIKAIKEQYPGIRVHLYSGDINDLAGRLEQGLLDYAVIAQEVDLSKYNYLELSWADVWGVILRRDDPLSAKESLGVEDLLDTPLIVSRQGLREDLPRLFGEKVDHLNVTATINLAYSGVILVREGIGNLLSFDKLANTGQDSKLCFRPLSPRLETPLYLIWKRYQVFSPAAELLLDHLKGVYTQDFLYLPVDFPACGCP